jgi:hypothetical protein
MSAISPVNFKGTYFLPYQELKNLKTEDKTKSQAFGRETGVFILDGGSKLEQTQEGLKVTVPFEKEQQYEALLAKYGLSTNLVD